MIGMLQYWAAGLSIVDQGEQALTRLQKKAREAQQQVLGKYGVLADLSGLDEAQLDRALEMKVALGSAQHMTFAGWCDQLLGPGVRVRVATFDDVAGQTKVSSLIAGRDLSTTLKAMEKKHHASLRIERDQVKQLRAEVQALEQAATTSASVEKSVPAMSTLGGWYYLTAASLMPFLYNINEVDGPIFEYQGAVNRDYRRGLVKIILDALHYLDNLGFQIEVVLRETTNQGKISPVILYRSLEFRENLYCYGFDFSVDEIQADIIEAGRAHFSLENEYAEMDQDIRFDCHVAVVPRETTDDKELYHLSCFLHKLFEAVSRSADGRPRGALLEKIILAMLLSRTAPCMAGQVEGPRAWQLRRDSYHTFYLLPEDGAGNMKNGPNVSAGKILEIFFQVMSLA
ncbi:MAG: hypothetical protein CMK96_11045 [Pseudomonas sp.]|jgi:hypothetical protein|uniref:hypothetical protein n=1 Tax=Stutzerimonas stutzeri subgroup TaxID=578833 RepID=UPI000695E406|nr:hypothetical protein [Stutzerimonas kunmingensis]MAF86297.1 hypothetical protein [Pseudomonas sp.]MAK87442.1 hypothetical protein [Pseudomonas sp.]HCH75433.1 hypothetical protein [Pseudomonas sp.]|tara:strand:- start:3100 stop:4299 length:1200 start_codon:yes stop_codon:yes gene_type:complete